MYALAIRHRLETELGVTVTHCASFSALRDEMARPDNTFALAILDLNQSDGTDGEALDFVLARGMRPIVFTASRKSDIRDRAMARNTADFVLKASPESIDQLVRSVDATLSRAKPHVLVVDPDRLTAEALCDIAADAGFQHFHCDSIETALDRLDAVRAIDMAILRVDGGSDWTGFLAQSSLRLGEGALRTIGFAKRGAKGLGAAFLGAGGDDFIAWPAEAEEVAARMQRLHGWHGEVRALARMASRDYLTDLFNRRYFFDRGPKLVDRCLRQDCPVAAVILDIDRFKALNDTYGHEIGDVVLKTIARKLRSLVGEDEHLLARLGGEEFGIILAGLDIKAAFEFCDMLREEISKARIVVDEEELSVTISMGLAEISAAETFDNYLNAADQYLYMAKHSGRNRVFSDYQVLQSATTSSAVNDSIPDSAAA